jgi:glycosyltransferase involved in cell wall biosynthesis
MLRTDHFFIDGPMRIAFYAPLKSPNHSVPSGDRLMARQLIAALELAGHSVEIASELRSFTATPDRALRAEFTERAEAEIARLLSLPAADRPQLWFTYHTYYKTPDQIGPAVARRLDIPYVTAEASYSARQDMLGWQDNQRLVADAVEQAAVNLCFTERDRLGLVEAVPQGVYARFPPFIDPSPFQSPTAEASRRLVTVAMMRGGDKFDSYAMLARALDLIRDRNWRLTVIGDGPKLAEVKAMFAAFDPQRIAWLGQKSAGEIAAELGSGGIYVWPGCGEAYGLAYLEAAAAGLPAVAQSTAGVPEVVIEGETGILTQDGDVGAFAAAIARLLDDPDRQRSMGAAARRFVVGERSLTAASKRLDTILQQHLGERYAR